MANQRRLTSAARTWSLGGWTRDVLGCIATYSDGDVRHFTGKGYVRAAADHADEHGTLIVSLSTPETIYRDLQGTRAHIEPRYDTHQPPDAIAIPEAAMLGRIGRRELLQGWEARPKHG